MWLLFFWGVWFFFLVVFFYVLCFFAWFFSFCTSVIYNQVKVLDSVHGIAGSVMNGVLGSSDKDWFLTEGRKGMDSDWLKSIASQLTQDDLKKFAND